MRRHGLTEFLERIAFSLSAQEVEIVDTSAIRMIREEGLNRSHAMELMSWLTDVYGPRLTGSPEYREAAEWAKKTLESWGMQNVHYDRWGPFGRGWTLKKFNFHLLQPRSTPMIAYPKAWSPGTKGVVRGNVVYLDAKTEADLDQYKGKLKGAFVLITEPRELQAHWEPEAKRLDDAELLKLANAGIPAGRQQQGVPDSAALQRFMQTMRLPAKKLEFAQKEGALVALEMAFKGDGGNIFVSGASVPSQADVPFGQRIGPYHESAPQIIPQVVVAPEHYNRLVRLARKKQPVRIEMELAVEFTKPDSGFNIIAEIPGTDLKDEIVMIGAHFDSWHGGTGATDNATGSVAVLEAARILKALNLQPRRTIRIGLWGGEEQGLLGSRAYVSKHLAEREVRGFTPTGPVTTKPQHEQFSVYFNNDNGTGKVRGVYMQGNEQARPIFRVWLAPFEDLGASTLSLSNTGGTDHLAFDAVGLPGFQFIQDPVEYSPRTHHSIMDVYDRVQEEDIKQASVMMAAFAYNAAMRNDKFPRKPMPAPPQRGPAGSQ
ncbi:MAG: M20/M25/M40 family metallo-hydrolase [Bacteroidota bacterium]